MAKILRLPDLYHPDFAIPNQKPVGPVKIKQTHRLAKHLVGCYIDGQYDLVSGIPTTFINAAPVSSPNGIGPAIPNPAGARVDCNRTFFSGSQNRTLIAGFYFKASYTDEFPIFFSQGTNTTSNRWGVRLAGNGSSMRVDIQGAGYSTTGITTSAGFHVVACKLDGTTIGDHKLFYDRQSESATGSTTLITDEAFSGTWFSQENYSSTDVQLDDTPMMFGYIFDIAVPDNEIFSFVEDGYQLVEPEEAVS